MKKLTQSDIEMALYLLSYAYLGLKGEIEQYSLEDEWIPKIEEFFEDIDYKGLK